MQHSNESAARPSNNRWKRCVRPLLLSTALAGVNANAQSDIGGIEWNGFLNIVGGVLRDSTLEDFSDSKQHPDYQGYESDFTFAPQTSAGLQAKKQLDEQTAITMQLYSEGDTDNYKANLKWLYLTYTPGPHSTFRIGRIGTPVYYFSDSLNIGYTYHWIQPPEPVYPFDTTLTGIDYIYSDVWNDIEWSAEVLTGSADDYLVPIESRVTTRNNVGVAFSASTDNWLSFRAMYYRADTTFQIDTFTEEGTIASIEEAVAAGLAAQGYTPAQIEVLLPITVEAAIPKIMDEDFNIEDFVMEYVTLAVRAETERWLFMSEISTVQTDAYLFGDLIARYVTGGVRFGHIMYYLSVADGRTVAGKDLKRDIHYTLPATPDNNDYIDFLAAQYKTRVAGSFSRSVDTVAIGTRIETSANTAVKFEILRFEEQPLFHGDTFAVGKNMLIRAALNATF